MNYPRANEPTFLLYDDNANRSQRLGIHEALPWITVQWGISLHAPDCDSGMKNRIVVFVPRVCNQIHNISFKSLRFVWVKAMTDFNYGYLIYFASKLFARGKWVIIFQCDGVRGLMKGSLTPFTFAHWDLTETPGSHFYSNEFSYKGVSEFPLMFLWMSPHEGVDIISTAKHKKMKVLNCKQVNEMNK